MYACISGLRIVIYLLTHAYTHFQTGGTASPADPWLYRRHMSLHSSSWDTASVSTNTEHTLNPRNCVFMAQCVHAAQCANGAGLE